MRAGRSACPSAGRIAWTAGVMLLDFDVDSMSNETDDERLRTAAGHDTVPLLLTLLDVLLGCDSQP